MGKKKSKTNHRQGKIQGRQRARAGEHIRNWASQFKACYHLNLPDGIALLFSLTLSFWLRITGFDWGGIQSIYQPDERKLVLTVVRMAQSGSLSSDNFYYPNQFLSKLHALLLMIYQEASGKIFDGYMAEPYWLCRAVTAVAGTLAIYVCFLIGNYFYRHLGAVFAFLMAVSPHMVAMAKQVTGDVNACLFAALSMLFALRYSEGRKKRYLCLMSMGAAMATMEKWHGGFVTVFIALTVAIYAPSIAAFIRHGLVAFFSYFAWIFLIAPSVILHFQTAVTDGFLNIAVYDNAEGPGYLNNASFYVRESVLHSGGILYILAIIFGLFLIFRSKNKRYSILLAGAVKVAILSLLNRSFTRWELEMILCELFLISLSLCFLWNAGKAWAQKRQWAGRAALAISGVCLVLDGFSGCLLINLVALRKEQDVRYIQEQYCRRHAITPNNAISGYYSAYAPGGIRRDVWEYERIYEISDAFLLRDGEAFKLQDKKYYIWTSHNGGGEIKQYLDAHCPVVERFEREYYDVFGIPILNVPYSLWDPILVRNNFLAIQKVQDGAYIGLDSIVIYDIRDLEVA